MVKTNHQIVHRKHLRCGTTPLSIYILSVFQTLPQTTFWQKKGVGAYWPYRWTVGRWLLLQEFRSFCEIFFPLQLKFIVTAVHPSCCPLWRNHCQLLNIHWQNVWYSHHRVTNFSCYRCQASGTVKLKINLHPALQANKNVLLPGCSVILVTTTLHNTNLMHIFTINKSFNMSFYFNALKS